MLPFLPAAVAFLALLAGAGVLPIRVSQASQQRCENSAEAVAGRYDNGQVGSRGALSPITTWLSPDGRGGLSGRYVMHEAGGNASGTLVFQGWTGCGTASFAWRDHYGKGVAVFQFYDAPVRGFEGNYGTAVPNGNLIWTGTMGAKPRGTPPVRPKS